MKRFLLGLFLFGILFLTSQVNNAQQTTSKKHNSNIGINCVLWTVAHPFVARKALVISQEVIILTDSFSIKFNLSTLHHNQTDAFKHALWMVLLSKEIGIKKAKKLGFAYELDGKSKFKKRRTENNEAMSIMDLNNNAYGLILFSNFKFRSNDELIIQIINDIYAGNLFILKQDCLGNFLDSQNKIIEKEITWSSKKIVLQSKQTCY